MTYFFCLPKFNFVFCSKISIRLSCGMQVKASYESISVFCCDLNNSKFCCNFIFIDLNNYYKLLNNNAIDMHGNSHSFVWSINYPNFTKQTHTHTRALKLQTVSNVAFVWPMVIEFWSFYDKAVTIRTASAVYYIIVFVPYACLLPIYEHEQAHTHTTQFELN